MIWKESRSFPITKGTNENAIVCTNNNGVVVNIPKPLKQCIKSKYRVGFWRLKK